VQAKCHEVLRDIEAELKGEIMTGVLALVSPGFFDKLIGHSKGEEIYIPPLLRLMLSLPNPLRDDSAVCNPASVATCPLPVPKVML
jgi:Phage major capsid protein E